MYEVNTDAESNDQGKEIQKQFDDFIGKRGMKFKDSIDIWQKGDYFRQQYLYSRQHSDNLEICVTDQIIQFNTFTIVSWSVNLTANEMFHLLRIKVHVVLVGLLQQLDLYNFCHLTKLILRLIIQSSSMWTVFILQVDVMEAVHQQPYYILKQMDLSWKQITIILQIHWIMHYSNKYLQNYQCKLCYKIPSFSKYNKIFSSYSQSLNLGFIQKWSQIFWDYTLFYLQPNISNLFDSQINEVCQYAPQINVYHIYYIHTIQHYTLPNQVYIAFAIFYQVFDVCLLSSLSYYQSNIYQIVIFIYVLLFVIWCFTLFMFLIRRRLGIVHIFLRQLYLSVCYH